MASRRPAHGGAPWIRIRALSDGPCQGARVRRLTSLAIQVKGLTIAQFPTWPLVVAVVASLTAAFTEHGAHTAAQYVAKVALIIWAALEVFSGVNWFRRLLGLAVLTWLAIGLAA